MLDFTKIAHAALVNARSLIEEKLPGGCWRGREYVVRNPLRNDAHLGSFKINAGTGVWSDFATNSKGGDLISLLAYLNGTKQNEAARQLANELGIALNGANGNGKAPRPEHIYELKNISGELIAEHFRIDARNGCDKKMWLTKGAKTRDLPLFHSELTPFWAPGSTVIVVEGEKVTLRLQRMSLYALGTACGASVTPNDAALAVLLPFKPIMWADNDPRGRDHMKNLSSRLVALGMRREVLHQVDIASIPELAAPGADAADLDDDLVRDVLDRAVRPFEMLPPVTTITVEGGKLPSMADEAQGWLSREHSTAGIYDRGQFLVRIMRNELSSDEEPRIRRSIGAPSLQQCSVTMAVDVLTRGIAFQKLDRRAKKMVAIDCPPKLAETVLSRAGNGRVKPLIGFIEAPLMRPDGTILINRGYDNATGLLLLGSEPWLPVPAKPTAAEIVSAVHTLRSPFLQFPFVSEADRAVIFSGILTGIQRRLLFSAPAHSLDANTQGAGKSLLAALIAHAVTGRSPVCMSLGKDETELRKLLVSILLAGDAVVSIDNISRSIHSDALASILTEPGFNDRILGASQRLELQTNLLWLLTGNNLKFSGDMPSRVLASRIVPEEEDPTSRVFKIPDLRSYLSAHRREIVAAALTILRGHFVAGRPEVGLRAWGRFEQWSREIRCALVWAGFADPCETRARIVEDDPERDTTQALLESWYAQIGDRPIQSLALLESVAQEHERHRQEPEYQAAPIYNALSAVAMTEKGSLSAHRFGQWCGNHADRIVGGHQLRKSTKAHGVNRWRVVRTDIRNDIEEQAGP